MSQVLCSMPQSSQRTIVFTSLIHGKQIGTCSKTYRYLYSYVGLEYFTDGVAVSVSSVKERILRLSSEKLRKDLKGQIALSELQMKIIEFLNQKGSITNRDIRSMFKLSNRGAVDEIKKLLALGILKIEGKGRSVHYILV